MHPLSGYAYARVRACCLERSRCVCLCMRLPEPSDDDDGWIIKSHDTWRYDEKPPPLYAPPSSTLQTDRLHLSMVF